MENLLKYSSSGGLPIFKIKGSKYIILAKRSDDANTNPGSHSGFFGWADNESESLDPDSITRRELLEEILIASKDQEKAYNLVFKSKDVCKQNNITKTLINLWNKEKRFNIKKDNIISIDPFSTEKVEFIEPSGRTKIFILEFDLDKFDLDFDNMYLFDGETKKDLPEPKGLLDRELDVFNLFDFKKWWNDCTIATLNATVSYKAGNQEITKGSIDRKTKNKISPTLVLTLNKW